MIGAIPIELSQEIGKLHPKDYNFLNVIVFDNDFGIDFENGNIIIGHIIIDTIGQVLAVMSL